MRGSGEVGVQQHCPQAGLLQAGRGEAILGLPDTVPTKALQKNTWYKNNLPGFPFPAISLEALATCLSCGRSPQLQLALHI